MHISALLKKERRKARQGSNNTADGSNNGTDIDKTLTTNSFLETTTVYYNPSFVGYLIAMARLLKQAFFHNWPHRR